MWVRMAGYGIALAAGTFLLQWLEYDRLARARPAELYFTLVALAFLGLGVWAGAKLFAGPPPAPFDGNPKAQEALGLSAREIEVLTEIAAGHSNKDIASRLHVSPNTVKTHTQRLYDKLGARRRTEAIARARDLGILR